MPVIIPPGYMVRYGVRYKNSGVVPWRFRAIVMIGNVGPGTAVAAVDTGTVDVQPGQIVERIAELHVPPDAPQGVYSVRGIIYGGAGAADAETVYDIAERLGEVTIGAPQADAEYIFGPT